MHYKRYKKILSAQNGMNLYRGCTHGCIYCDSRSLCYQMDHAFEDIEVKTDAPEQLLGELMRKRKKVIVGTGSMCDPYIDLEADLLQTRRALEAIAQSGHGLAIQTKSAMILRDLDLLKTIHKNAKCVVQMTLTTFDEALCKKLEPNVSTTRERFEALCVLRDAGIPTVVWLSPFLPFINDTQENLDGLIQYVIDARVSAVLCFGIGVTLRAGSREYFYKQLDRHFPGIKAQYIQRYGESYECHSPNQSSLMKHLKAQLEPHKILLGTTEVFQYMRTLNEPKSYEQLTLF